MNSLALTVGVLFLAGCAATKGPGTDARVGRLNEEIGEVWVREQQCIKEAQAKAVEEVSRIAAVPDVFADLDTRTAESDYYWEAWQCQAEAYRENEELSAREREEYDLAQRQERDHAALLATLIASRPH